MPNVGENETLFEDAQKSLAQIGTADIVLGVPTYNHRETIACPVNAGIAAFQGGGSRAVIIQADGGSTDGTAEHFREIVGERMPLVQVRYPVYPVDRISAPLAGVPGRTAAAIAIFQLARQLQARACVLLDAAVQSVATDWVERLLQPVLEGGADLIVPLYQRHAFDGLINSGIASPFARALFGRRLRQPSGADLAFSARLMDFYAEPPAQARAIPDPWSTIPAIANGFQVGHSFLGPRSTLPSEVPPDLSTTLQIVLGSIFEQTEQTAPFWQKVRGSEPAPWFGPRLDVEAEPGEINRKPMVDSFRQGCHDLLDIWKLIIPPASLLALRRMERQEELRFADDLWARVVYDFALGYHGRVMGREHLLKAITPLYLGWAASFTSEMENAGGADVEQRLERLSLEFEAQKRYLISRWRWPDRFNA
jgi:hypothetical protein